MPDHVITRVMVTELEKRREQHWLLDGECRGANPSPTVEHPFVPNALAVPGERKARMLLLEKQELMCRQGHFPLASACAHPAEPWAGKGKGRERSWLFHRAQQGREKLLPSFTCL